MTDREIETFVRDYYRLVFTAAYRVLGNAEDAAEVSQEAFVKYFEKAPKKIHSVGAWLHTVATRAALDRRSSDVQRKVREQRYGAAWATESGDDLSPDVLWELEEALNNLPDNVRVPIVEHYYLKRTHKSIARDLGVARQTVSRRIDQGLAQLRDELGKFAAPGAAIAIPAYLYAEPESITWAALETNTIKALPSGTSAVATGTAATQQTTLSLSTVSYALAPVIVATVALAAWMFSTGPQDVGALPTPETETATVDETAGETAPADNAEPMVVAQIDSATVAQNLPPAPIQLPEDIPADTARRIEENLPPDIPEDLRGPGVGPIENGSEWVKIRGTVVNQEGKPLEGAMVVVSASGHVGIEADRAAFAAHRAPSRRYITETDSRGRYEITDVAFGGSARVSAGTPEYPAYSHHIGVIPGEVQKEVNFVLVHLDEIKSSPGHSTQTGVIRMTQPDGTILEHQLESTENPGYDKAGMVIRGKLVDENDQPIPHAFLSVPLYISDIFFTTTTARNSTVTNNEGEFALRVWHEVTREAGQHGLASIIVSTADGKNATFSSVPYGRQPGSETLANPKLVFPKPATIRGKIVAPEWAPAGPYWVGVAEILSEDGEGLSSRYDYGLCSAFGGWTNEDGTFDIPNIPSKRAFQMYVFNSNNFDVAVRQEIEPLDPGQTLNMDIPIYNGHLVEGQVTSTETGEPIGHVRIGAHHPQRVIVKSEYCWADENGHFVMCIPRELGQVRLFATYDASGYGTMSTMIQGFGKNIDVSGEGPSTHNLSIPKPIPIELHVIDEKNNPVPGVSVWRINTPFGVTDQDGIFRSFHNPEFERAFKLQKAGYFTVNAVQYEEPIDPDSPVRYTRLLRAAGGIEGTIGNLSTDELHRLEFKAIFEDETEHVARSGPLDVGAYFIVAEQFPVKDVKELHVNYGPRHEWTFNDLKFEQGVVIDLGVLQ